MSALPKPRPPEPTVCLECGTVAAETVCHICKIPRPIAGETCSVPDEALLIDVAQQAIARHLHLVIDRDGLAKLTPQVLPGMQKIYVVDRDAKAAA